MKNVSLISKITERGQITLPKKIRTLGTFKHARAVQFTARDGLVFLEPIGAPQDEHLQLLNETMRGWSHPQHDDLFDFSARA